MPQSFHSQSSDISSAEEVTETFINDEDDISSSLNINDHTRIPSDNTLSCTELNNSSIIYDSITLDHIQIKHLHVDKDLKPYHLLTNRCHPLITDESSFVKKRRNSILQYLMIDQKNNTIGIQKKRELFNSLTNLTNDEEADNLARCNSLNDIYYKRNQYPENYFNNFKLSEDQSVNAQTPNTDGAMSSIMENLDFQVDQRNERSHFILSELLIQTIEFLYSDEVINRSSYKFPKPTQNIPLTSFVDTNSPHEMSNKSMCNSSTALNFVEPSSKADTITFLMLDEIMKISSIVNNDRSEDILPISLQLLRNRLEGQREFSSSDKCVRYQPGNLNCTSPKIDYFEKDEIPPEENDEKIQALVETCSLPLNIPVGLFPEIGRNLSLPIYVATRGNPITKHSAVLKLQDNRCLGCHLSFSLEMAKRFRLCHYYGLYFCSVCHNNTLMMIPARILTIWDFTMLPVSCLARDLLKLIHSEPLFSIDHFSDKLRVSLTVLNSVMRLRRQGQLLLEFILTCRKGYPLKCHSDKFPSHWLSKYSQKFSIADFQMMESGVMVKKLKSFATWCVDHISICPLCQAHGFMCELCENKEIIFPFEIDKVYQCKQCHACFHIRCYQKSKLFCPRCQRRKVRQEKIQNATNVLINY